MPLSLGVVCYIAVDNGNMGIRSSEAFYVFPSGPGGTLVIPLSTDVNFMTQIYNGISFFFIPASRITSQINCTHPGPSFGGTQTKTQSLRPSYNFFMKF